MLFTVVSSLLRSKPRSDNELIAGAAPVMLPASALTFSSSSSSELPDSDELLENRDDELDDDDDSSSFEDGSSASLSAGLSDVSERRACLGSGSPVSALIDLLVAILCLERKSLMLEQSTLPCMREDTRETMIAGSQHNMRRNVKST